MGKLCRYDHVVQAVEALQRYMDTCGLESDTQRLIKNAHDALHELEEIERGIRSRGPTKEHRPMTTVMGELEEKLGRFDGHIGRLEEFFAANKEDLDAARDSAKLLKEILGQADSLKQILAGMKRVRKKVAARMEGVREPIVGAWQAKGGKTCTTETEGKRKTVTR